ncbi:threonine/homoserine/homoserine lactone efflux protein [Methanohalophilus levihalophilus]|uniref:LysE family transporter n=1 Tax=Methanohalophilus levihalophilus TaxID=1431282 RepID=UPI001AE590CF|nr:LysE family transporter [Methanohalophilus levihalophilus]MBP2031173.1 threonine/homoserine/homoserine lactone efflux protein [Methanohalophilus levihalophilus]
MLEIIEMLTIGFVVGLTGALVPGPMLLVTIDGALKKGWKAGPAVVVGHAAIELLICILIVLGLTSLIGEREMTVISIVGGTALFAFGILTIMQARSSSQLVQKADGIVSNSFSAGVLTSVSNPYFWIWWLAAGSALLLRGLEIGLLAAVFFVIGHWMADLGWFTFISASMSRGKQMFSDVVYRKVLVGCGIFLMGFGAWFALG